MFSEFRHSRIFLRRSTGVYDALGKWVEDSSPVDVLLQGSLQPTTGKDLQQLPEGRRTNANYKLYTSTALSTVEEQNPDTIIIDDDEYEVVTIMPWGNNIINHYKVILSKKTEQ